MSPFGSGLFLQFAPEFGSLLTSQNTITRELPNQIIRVNGDTIANPLFANGTTKETLEDGPIQGVNKLRIAIFFPAGYDFRLLKYLSIVPEASYNLPLTTISSSSGSSNWKISSLVLALAIKYRFD